MPERKDGSDDFWIETISCEWQFKQDDAWIDLQFNRGKHYSSGTLHYLPTEDEFELRMLTSDKKKQIFRGSLEKNRYLRVVRIDPETKTTHRLTISLLHETRFLYEYAVANQGSTYFRRIYRVGATRKGVQFAAGDHRPECIVSGGLGTSTVSYKGKTYYVCCSGCRAAFNENPEKYIKEFEAKKKKHAK
ncbi:MAG: hypothetical protein KatS3mg105_2429 [Gemmatales bacterium]|nr:MAG: hypothetical protein KatS3mg105_2429 [Gemmatales bacterium]